MKKNKIKSLKMKIIKKQNVLNSLLLLFLSVITINASAKEEKLLVTKCKTVEKDNNGEIKSISQTENISDILYIFNPSQKEVRKIQNNRTTNYQCKRVDIKPISETSDLYYDFICYKNEKPIIIRFTYNNQDGGYFDGVIEITQFFVKQYFTPDKESIEENIKSNFNSDYNSIKSVVQSWNKTHQDYNFTAMQKLYSDEVLYYGKKMVNKDIVLSKQSFMKKYKDFNQNILGDLNIKNLDKNKMKVSFIKQASFGGKQNEYPSYLEIEKTNAGWKICTESDDVTDKNLAKRIENKVLSTERILKRTYIKNNNVFVEFANYKEKQLTYNGKDSDPIIIDANTVFFVRKQYDVEDNEVNVFMSVEVGMLKEKVIKTLGVDFYAENLKLSNDKKHIFYFTNLYATNDAVVKINIYTGVSQNLFACDWYHEIISGDFKGYFINYVYGFKDGKLGRQYFYRLCDSQGRPYKTFENETAMNDFAKANNINL